MIATSNINTVLEEKKKIISEEPPAPPRRKPKKVNYPRRQPSEVIPERKIVYITPDKTTCVECPCFPKEDPYVKPKKLNPCLISPLTLYELAAKVADNLPFPEAFNWSEEDVAEWMANEVGLPEYKECILENHINGMRLLMLENPSHMPEINIHYMSHIKMITEKVHEVFSTEFIRFARSIGLPPRKPLTHCTWFKSRTGPNWGIRKNWTRCDILRWMKVLMPEPLYLDHWDLVWYHKPQFPDVKFARIAKSTPPIHIPRYIPAKFEECREYLVPRKFRIIADIPEEEQLIWMERIITPKPPKPKKKRVLIVPKKTRLFPEKISATGLVGKELLLARRKMPTPKFLP